MVKIRVTLPLVKQTPSALRYALPDRRLELAVSDIYVRKDKLREAGLTGYWPTEITLTLEANE